MSSFNFKMIFEWEIVIKAERKLREGLQELKKYDIRKNKGRTNKRF